MKDEKSTPIVAVPCRGIKIILVYMILKIYEIGRKKCLVF
jgi:hypothetical protein